MEQESQQWRNILPTNIKRRHTGNDIQSYVRQTIVEWETEKHEEEASPFSWGLLGHRKLFLNLLVWIFSTGFRFGTMLGAEMLFGKILDRVLKVKMFCFLRVIGLPVRAFPWEGHLAFHRTSQPSLGSHRCCYVTSGNRWTEQWLHACQSYTLTNVSCLYDFHSLSWLTGTFSVQWVFSIFATNIQNESRVNMLYVHFNKWSSSF